MEEQRYAYVGVCRKCGALCCASVDTPERTKENARYTSQWIRQGMTVERVTADVVRARLADCKCKS